MDEVDKIRSHVGGQPNVAGIRAQEALLTLIENEAVTLDLPDWAGGGTATVNSSELLFVCAGAFEGLYDSVFDRVTIGKDRGALRPVTVVEGGKVTEKLVFHLRDWLRNEDLFDYGMSPQFLSRFDAVVLLHDLGQDELVRIFLETPGVGLPPEPRLLREPRNPPGDLAGRRAPHRRPRPAASPASGPGAEGGLPPRDPRLRVRPLEFVTGGALLIDLPEVEAVLGKG